MHLPETLHGVDELRHGDTIEIADCRWMAIQIRTIESYNLQRRSAIAVADSPDPPRRHGRVLRVGRAARRSVAPRQAGGRRRPAGPARRRRRRQLRGARVRRPLGDVDGPGRAALSVARRSSGPTSRATRRPRRRSSRSSARSRRSSSRCRSTRRISTSPRTRGTSRWPRTVARRLKERIRAETGLTASAGVAPNKFLAKIASGWKKPDGLTVISPERVEPFLQQLPVDALWGVGPVTARSSARAASSASSTSGPSIPRCCAKRSAASPTGCASWPTASTSGRSCRTASRSRPARRTRIPRT